MALTYRGRSAAAFTVSDSPLALAEHLFCRLKHSATMTYHLNTT